MTNGKPGLKAAMLGVISAGLLATTTAQADEGVSVQKSVDYRTSYMTLLGWHSKPMIKMLKGEAEFDDEAFLSHASQLAAVSKLDLLMAFPEDSTTDDSAAMSEIWFDFEDFEQKFADFRAAGAQLGEAAGSGDVAATKQAFSGFGDTCKGCHKKYKE
jgi:cytochrome c556